MRYICTILLLVCSSCAFNAKMISKSADALPKYVPQPVEQVLVFSTFDIASRSFRKNKEALFYRIQDSMLVTAAAQLQLLNGSATTLLPGFTSLAAPADSSIKALMLQKNATQAVIISNFDVYFHQTKVDVTKTESGKEGQRFYDIIATADYSMYDQQGLVKKTPVKVNRYHSNRQVVSGLLSAGPDISANGNDALNISRINVEEYIYKLYPARGNRSRAD